MKKAECLFEKIRLSCSANSKIVATGFSLLLLLCVNSDALAQKDSSYEDCLREFKCDQAIRKLQVPLTRALSKNDFAKAGKVMRMIALAFRLDENDQAAAQAAEIAMKLDPEDTFGNFQLAEYELRNGAWQKADSIFEELSKSKNSKISQRAIAFLAQQKGAVLQSMQLLEDYAKRYPDDQRALMRLAYLYLVNEEDKKASEANILLSNLSDSNYLKEIYSGRAAEAIHHLKEAEDHYRRAGAYISDDPLWHSQLGLLFMKNGKIKEARQEFRLCFALRRLCGKAYTSWAVMEAFFGSKTSAEICLNRLQQLRPNFNELYFVKGIVDEKSGNYQNAVNAFNKAIELYPHNSTPYIHLLQSQEIKNDQAKRIALCRKWVINCPQSALGSIELANALYQSGKKEESMQYYLHADSLVKGRPMPKDSNYQIAICKMYASMAGICYEKGLEAEAIKWAQQFNALRPAAAETAGIAMRPARLVLEKLKDKSRTAAEHALLADSLYENGALAAAEKEYRKALSDDPHNISYHSALLKVLLDKRDYAAAASEDAAVTQHVLSHVPDFFSSSPGKTISKPKEKQ